MQSRIKSWLVDTQTWDSKQTLAGQPAEPPRRLHSARAISMRTAFSRTAPARPATAHPFGTSMPSPQPRVDDPSTASTSPTPSASTVQNSPHLVRYLAMRQPQRLADRTPKPLDQRALVRLQCENRVLMMRVCPGFG